MTPIPPEHRITDVAALERLYGAPSGAAVEKELDYTAPALLERFAMDGRLLRSVIAVSVDTVFFQSSRAIWRSKLWDRAQQIERESLPRLGTVVSDVSRARIKAEQYDEGPYERPKASLHRC